MADTDFDKALSESETSDSSYQPSTDSENNISESEAVDDDSQDKVQ